MEDCKYRSRLKECSWARSVHIFGLVGFFFFFFVYKFIHSDTLLLGSVPVNIWKGYEMSLVDFPREGKKKMKRKRKEKRCLGDEGGTRQDKTVEIQAEEAFLDYNCSTVKQKSFQTKSQLHW